MEILEAIGIDYIDESEVLTPADETHHIMKHNFKVPFVCGCRNLGEALRRIAVILFLTALIVGRSRLDPYKRRGRNR
jgi:pyridoxal biosynthesis lyase PdxS